MANDFVRFYHYYRRYRWSEGDFENLQLLNWAGRPNGESEGSYGGAVLKGMLVQGATGLNVAVGVGIAVGPTGDLMVRNAGVVLPVAAPTGANQVRSLVVVRPQIVDNQIINRPTNPFDPVPLYEDHYAQVVVIDGTQAADPQYPSTQPNDVVLAGIHLTASDSVITDSNIDLTVKDSPSKNSELLAQLGRYDARTLPYRVSNHELGVKPAQAQAPLQRMFTIKAGLGASKFPRDISGNFNYADTVLNFQSGAISGGDAQSPAFTPTIPSSGSYIVAGVFLKRDDTLVVKYGTQGTLSQCLSGIVNQTRTGAGSCPFRAFTQSIAFVVLGSTDGANLNSLDFFDARGLMLSDADPEVDAVVGTLGFGSHATLAQALADGDVQPGSTVVVGEDQTITSPITIAVNNVKVRFKPGVKLVDGGAATGIVIAASGVVVEHPKMQGFTVGMHITGDYAVVVNPRFKTCTNELIDDTFTSDVIATKTEI